jgi:DNA-binding transcriptional LysR family regulator
MNFVVTGNYICDQIQPAIELAKNGLGILYAPFYSIIDELNSGALLPCISGSFQIDHSHYLVYRKKDHQPHRVKIIIDAIIEYLRENAPLLI